MLYWCKNEHYNMQKPNFHSFLMLIVCLWQQTGVHHALNPDQYRGNFGSDGVKYARDVQEIIDYGTCGRVAGFIAEAIQVMLPINRRQTHKDMLSYDCNSQMVHFVHF